MSYYNDISTSACGYSIHKVCEFHPNCNRQILMVMNKDMCFAVHKSLSLVLLLKLEGFVVSNWMCEFMCFISKRK